MSRFASQNCGFGSIVRTALRVLEKVKSTLHGMGMFCTRPQLLQQTIRRSWTPEINDIALLTFTRCPESRHAFGPSAAESGISGRLLRQAFKGSKKSRPRRHSTLSIEWRI